VRALARHARRDAPGALTSLARLLALAEPQGYVRVVLDEGPPMAALLKVAAKQGSARTYLRRLLAAAGTGESGVGAGQASVEQLSDRELEVLRLLATDLDGPGIARQLVVSLHTVRSHTNNIYAKLGVNSRRAAVRRSEDLDLLSRARSRQPRTNDLQDDSRE
jgi:ATP-dependent transcriptional regulator